jgi:hypothetical protein
MTKREKFSKKGKKINKYTCQQSGEMKIIIRTRGHAKADGLTPEVIDEVRIYGV